jgi:hypothetical protein
MLHMPELQTKENDSCRLGLNLCERPGRRANNREASDG